ncbi:hypothetical protein E5170_02530 [Pseudomonas atacamensis]|uniref:Uncharacterized protein n=1 Tax=Pseudomonas atacamensis TaxID=2565368 RepID=A0AAQ2DGQ1_9PSED|nr:hypothetical protein E5170_02530 [Pseudomonas atacamensis]
MGIVPVWKRLSPVPFAGAVFNVGASLLAKASCQSMCAVTGTPHSRAGSLPQGFHGVSAVA